MLTNQLFESLHFIDNYKFEHFKVSNFAGFAEIAQPQKNVNCTVFVSALSSSHVLLVM